MHEGFLSLKDAEEEQSTFATKSKNLDKGKKKKKINIIFFEII